MELKIGNSVVYFSAEDGSSPDALDAAQEIYRDVKHTNIIFVTDVEYGEKEVHAAVMQAFAKKFPGHEIVWVVKGPKADSSVSLANMRVECIMAEIAGYVSLQAIYDDEDEKRLYVYGSVQGYELYNDLMLYNSTILMNDALCSDKKCKIFAEWVKQQPKLAERLYGLLKTFH